jgi:hypothetical protein
MIVLTTEVESLKVRLYYKYYTTENKKVATQKFKNFARWVKARPLILTGSIDWTNDVCRTQLFEAITSYNVDGKTLLKPDCNISEGKISVPHTAYFIDPATDASIYESLSKEFEKQVKHLAKNIT